MLKFNLRSFIIFIILLFTEVLIEHFFKQGFIRYIFGDFLVVILLYYLFKSFFKTKPVYLAISVLLIAYSIEFLQLIDILSILNLKESRMSNLILGNTFSFEDLIAYTLGVATILIIEKITCSS